MNVFNVKASWFIFKCKIKRGSHVSKVVWKGQPSSDSLVTLNFWQDILTHLGQCVFLLWTHIQNDERKTSRGFRTNCHWSRSVKAAVYDAVSVSKLLILAIADLFQPSLNSISAMANYFSHCWIRILPLLIYFSHRWNRTFQQYSAIAKII